MRYFKLLKDLPGRMIGEIIKIKEINMSYIGGSCDVTNFKDWFQEVWKCSKCNSYFIQDGYTICKDCLDNKVEVYKCSHCGRIFQLPGDLLLCPCQLKIKPIKIKPKKQSRIFYITDDTKKKLMKGECIKLEDDIFESTYLTFYSNKIKIIFK